MNKPQVKQLVAMAYVKNIARSVQFYSALGFTVNDSFTPEHSDEIHWAYLECGAAQLMLSLASEPVIAEQQAVLFYLYFDHIADTHAHLKAQGFAVSEMSYPFYCPQGEFRLTDPDGYCLMLTHT